MAFNNLYKRSIYLEIRAITRDGKQGKILESFAFSVPPSALDIVKTQRTTVTPTPGGNFVDNYGLGNANINFSGETGNDESRLTILGEAQSPRYLTGQESWFEFNKHIVEFSATHDENYTMLFYDLTHKGSADIFNRPSFGKYIEAWEVVLNESASKRSSAKPFFYPYSVSLTGIRKIGVYDPDQAAREGNRISQITQAIDDVTAGVNTFRAETEVLLTNFYEYTAQFVGILTSLNEFADSFTGFTELFLEFESKMLGLFEDVVSESEEFLRTGVQIISFPYDVLNTALGKINDVSLQVHNLITVADQQGNNIVDKYDWDKIIGDFSALGESINETVSSVNIIKTIAKKEASNDPVGSIALEGVVYPIYGYTTIQIKENTRLDKLSISFYGDLKYKDIISGINGIYSDDELIAGEVLLMPIFESSARYSNNEVYTVPGADDDILGRDIRITEDGVILTTAEDYQLTKGEETVMQAVKSRLSEKIGRQLQDGSYGIIVQVGEALGNDAPLEIIAVGTIDTLVQDPRIVDIYDMDFSLDGDSVYQTFKIDTLTITGISYKEGIV